MIFHKWVGCSDDNCDSCLVCGAHYDTARINAGDYSHCSGRTDQWHTATPSECAHILDECAAFDASGWESCEHIPRDCDCSICRG